MLVQMIDGAGHPNEVTAVDGARPPNEDTAVVSIQIGCLLEVKEQIIIGLLDNINSNRGNSNSFVVRREQDQQQHRRTYAEMTPDQLEIVKNPEPINCLSPPQ
jgi:hypothetical protein